MRLQSARGGRRRVWGGGFLVLILIDFAVIVVEFGVILFDFGLIFIDFCGF